MCLKNKIAHYFPICLLLIVPILLILVLMISILNFYSIVEISWSILHNLHSNTVMWLIVATLLGWNLIFSSKYTFKQSSAIFPGSIFILIIGIVVWSFWLFQLPKINASLAYQLLWQNIVFSFLHVIGICLLIFFGFQKVYLKITVTALQTVALQNSILLVEWIQRLDDTIQLREINIVLLKIGLQNFFQGISFVVLTCIVYKSIIIFKRFFTKIDSKNTM